MDTADFRMQAAQIRPRHKSMDPIAYTVVGGETLKDIARNVLGDASLWWRIAEANSLAVSGDGALTAGQTLTVPKLSLNANSVDTFQPYDPSQAMGSMDPVLPVPANGGGCGGIGAIIMIIIVVVVTIYTAGALSTVAGSATFGQTMAAGAATLSGTGTVAVGSAAASMGLGSAGAAAMAGAVGSIAGQMAGNLMGIQDGFSWKSVALSALGSGVASGLGSSGWLPSTDSAFTNAAVRQAMSSTISQGIGTVTGLQQRFDWRAVAAGAVGAGVGASVGQALQNGNAFASWNNEFATGLARGTISGFAGGLTTAVMRGGRISVRQVATDAFGNALGQSLAYSNGQASDAVSDMQEDVLGDFIARNKNFAERSYTFADSVATRQAANNPAGLPTYAPNTADDNPMAAAEYRNGSDIASDTYNGSRRTITIGRGQGPLAAMAAMGFNDQLQRAMYGQLARSGQLSFDGKGTPLVQPGQQLYVDLDDMSGARLGGRLIGAESSKRAALAAAEQRAYWDSLQAGAWSGRTSEGGPVWHAGGTQQVTGSAVDLIPTGGYAYVPAPQSMQPTGWIGKGLELIDDFNNSWAGKAAQGWPQENFAVGGAKAALLFAGTMGRNLPGDAAAVDRVVANVAGEASKIGTVGNIVGDGVGLAMTLSRVEGRFANASREVGFIVDGESGAILATRRSGLGSGTQISLDPVKDYPLMQGNVFTHNHPLGGNLSPGDVSTALGSGAAEFRAVTSNRTVSISFGNAPGGLIGEPAASVVFMNGEKAAIGASYRAGIADGSLLPPLDHAAKNIWMSDYFMQQLTRACYELCSVSAKARVEFADAPQALPNRRER